MKPTSKPKYYCTHLRFSFKFLSGRRWRAAVVALLLLGGARARRTARIRTHFAARFRFHGAAGRRGSSRRRGRGVRGTLGRRASRRRALRRSGTRASRKHRARRHRGAAAHAHQSVHFSNVHCHGARLLGGGRAAALRILAAGLRVTT